MQWVTYMHSNINTNTNMNYYADTKSLCSCEEGVSKLVQAVQLHQRLAVIEMLCVCALQEVVTMQCMHSMHTNTNTNTKTSMGNM